MWSENRADVDSPDASRLRGLFGEAGGLNTADFAASGHTSPIEIPTIPNPERSGRAVVEAEQPAESLPAFDGADGRADLVRRIDKLIAKTLVVAFLMKMRDVLADGPF